MMRRKGSLWLTAKVESRDYILLVNNPEPFRGLGHKPIAPIAFFDGAEPTPISEPSKGNCSIKKV